MCTSVPGRRLAAFAMTLACMAPHFACNNGASDDQAEAPPSDTGRLPPASATANDQQDERLPPALLGRWFRVEGDTGHFWHLAGDGQFVTSFIKAGEVDRSLFPEPMRNNATNWFGEWQATESELILTGVMSQNQKLPDEVRIPLKWEAGKNTIEINGATYRREQQ